MAFKPYADYDWLYREYVTKKRNAKDIGDELGVTEMTIYNHCKKFGFLKLRGKGRSLGSRTVRRPY